jgi:hypothetical protein
MPGNRKLVEQPVIATTAAKAAALSHLREELLLRPLLLSLVITREPRSQRVDQTPE